MTLTTEDPRTIGRYRLLSRLGAGGMGVVYLARSPSGRQVAVKVIRPDLAQNTDFRTRFRREVAAARQVSGAFTAAVVDADCDAENPWLATLYIAGPTLAEHVARLGPLAEPEVYRLALGLVEALHDIHRTGLVHRDLKPGNVLLADDGPRVIDFGIARIADATQLTSTGLIVGTPPFMAPEQFQRGEVGPATDVFSLGAVLSYAGTGHGPFDGDSSHAVGFRVVYEEPDLTGLPASLHPLVLHCLAKDPAARPTVGALLRTLPDTGPAAPVDSRPPSAYPPTEPSGAPLPTALDRSLPSPQATGSAPAPEPTETTPDLPEPPAPPEDAEAAPVAAQPTETTPVAPEHPQTAPAPPEDSITSPAAPFAPPRLPDASPPVPTGPPVPTAPPRRRTAHRWALAALAVVLVATAATAVPLLLDGEGKKKPQSQGEGAGTRPAEGATASFGCPASADTVLGSGASVHRNLMDEWNREFAGLCPNTSLTYQPSGAGSGLADFADGRTAFAVIEEPLDAEELGERASHCEGGRALHIPLGAAPVVVVVNLPGVEKIALSPAALAMIFNGDVTRWNARAVADTNPGVTLPDIPVKPITPSEASGTTKAFTVFLATHAPGEWKHPPATTLPVNGISARGSSGVTVQVQSTPGGVSVLPGAFATELPGLRAELATGGRSSSPATPEAVTKALSRAKITGTGNDLALSLPETAASGAYPLLQPVYAVVCEKTGSSPALRAFLTYALGEDGRSASGALGYGPLPETLADRARTAVRSLS